MWQFKKSKYNETDAEKSVESIIHIIHTTKNQCSSKCQVPAATNCQWQMQGKGFFPKSSKKVLCKKRPRPVMLWEGFARWRYQRSDLLDHKVWEANTGKLLSFITVALMLAGQHQISWNSTFDQLLPWWVLVMVKFAKMDWIYQKHFIIFNFTFSHQMCIYQNSCCTTIVVCYHWKRQNCYIKLLYKYISW